MFSLATLAVALLAVSPHVGLVLASPTVLTIDYAKREAAIAKHKRDTPTHCVDDIVGGPQTTGNLLCVDLGDIPPGKRGLQKRQSSTTFSCSQCLGQDGNTAISTVADTSICYITTGNGDESLGNQTSCPGDPPPSTNPDGTQDNLGAAIMDDFCAVAGTDGLFGWATFAVCYAYTFAQAGNDDNTAGAILLCDAFTAGLCTFLGASDDS